MHFNSIPEGSDSNEYLDQIPESFVNDPAFWGLLDETDPLQLASLPDSPLSCDDRGISITSMVTEQGAKMLKRMGYRPTFLKPKPGYSHISVGVGGETRNYSILRYFKVPLVFKPLGSQNFILGPPIRFIVMGNWKPRYCDFVIGSGDHSKLGLMPSVSSLSSTIPCAGMKFRNLANPNRCWEFKVPTIVRGSYGLSTEIGEIGSQSGRTVAIDPIKSARESEWNVPVKSNTVIYKVRVPLPAGTLCHVVIENGTYSTYNPMGGFPVFTTIRGCTNYQIFVKRNIDKEGPETSFPKMLPFRIIILSSNEEESVKPRMLPKTSGVFQKETGLSFDEDMDELMQEDDGNGRDPDLFFDTIREFGVDSKEFRDLVSSDASSASNIPKVELEGAVETLIQHLTSSYSTRIEELISQKTNEELDEGYGVADHDKNQKKKKRTKKKKVIEKDLTQEEISVLTSSSKRKGPTPNAKKAERKKRAGWTPKTIEEIQQLDNEWYRLRRICSRNTQEWLEILTKKFLASPDIDSIYEEAVQRVQSQDSDKGKDSEQSQNSIEDRITKEALTLAEIGDRVLFGMAYHYQETFAGEGQPIHLSDCVMDGRHIDPRKFPYKTVYKVNPQNADSLSNTVVNLLLKREQYSGILKNLGKDNPPLWCSPVGLANRKGDLGRLFASYLEPNLACIATAGFPVHKSICHGHLSAGQTKFYNSVDVSKAFNSIKCCYSLGRYLAVRSNDTIYIPERMTLGFKNVPSVFQCYAGSVFCQQGILPSFVESFDAALRKLVEDGGDKEGLPEHLFPHIPTLRSRMMAKIQSLSGNKQEQQKFSDMVQDSWESRGFKSLGLS